MDFFKNKSREEYLFLATSLFCLVPILIGLLIYNEMPENMPIHWNINGEVDGYTSRNMALFIMPTVMFIIDFIVKLAMITSSKEEWKKIKINKYLLPFLSILIILIEILSVKKIVGEQIILLFVFGFCGIIFISLGFGMSKIKQNKVIGVRTPWTLNDEENWEKTHKFSKNVFIICGIVFILLGLIDFDESLMSIILFVNIGMMALLTCGYSYIIYRIKLKESRDDNGKGN